MIDNVDLGTVSGEVTSGAKEVAGDVFTGIRNHKEKEKESNKVIESNSNFLYYLLVKRYEGTEKEEKWMKIYKILNFFLKPSFWVVSFITQGILEMFVMKMITGKMGHINTNNNFWKMYTFVGGITLNIYIIMFSLHIIHDEGLIPFIVTLLYFGFGFLVIGIAVSLIMKVIKMIKGVNIDGNHVSEKLEEHNDKMRQIQLEKEEQKQLEQIKKLQITFKGNTEKGKELVKDLKIKYLEYKPYYNNEFIGIVDNFINSIEEAPFLNDDEIKYVENEVNLIQEKINEVIEVVK